MLEFRLPEGELSTFKGHLVRALLFTSLGPRYLPREGLVKLDTELVSHGNLPALALSHRATLSTQLHQLLGGVGN